MGASILVALALQAATGWPWTGASAPDAHLFKPDQATVLSGRWNGRPVSVRLTPAIVPACHAAEWLHGAVPDRQDRCIRLGRIEMTVAGRPMQLSSDFYADLGGINDVVLASRSGRIVLYMRGPDGPDYYGATLTFGRDDIIRRQLDLADGGREVATYTAAWPQAR